MALPPQPPPPATPLSTNTTTPATTSTPTPFTTTTYASTESSPRSPNTDSYFDVPPPLSSKLRLMCSYGGHLIPGPHDKSLCYVGGDTRFVDVDHHTSLSSLITRLSNTFLNGRPFILKYTLPYQEFDPLISVTTDEDLDNMIDEYDRTNSNAANSSKPSRLSLFLFPLNPDSSQSLGPILDNSANSGDSSLNPLNGATRFSNLDSVNCLLVVDEEGNNDLIVGGISSSW